MNRIKFIGRDSGYNIKEGFSVPNILVWLSDVKYRD